MSPLHPFVNAANSPVVPANVMCMHGWVLAATQDVTGGILLRAQGAGSVFREGDAAVLAREIWSAVAHCQLHVPEQAISGFQCLDEGGGWDVI